jgi:voltage-gated potassium channel
MQKQQFHTNIFILLALMAVFFIIGAFIFRNLEHWSFINAFYFVVMTATTVGYGDLTPSHNLSKIITIVYSLSIIPFVIYTFSIIAKFHVERIYRKIYEIEHKQNIQKEELEKTEKRLSENKKRLKEQDVELKQQEKRMKKQIKLDREFEEEIFEHDKELEGHQKKIKKQTELAKIQEEEIQEHDKELEVVEKIVDKELKKLKK